MTAVVLAVILSFFVISLLRQHKRNLRLHREKMIAEMTTLENERTRIAKDLHDEIGPVLSAVKFQIGSIYSQDASDKMNIQSAGKNIDELLRRIREIFYNLMPTVLSRKGFLPAVQDFIDEVNYLQEIKVEYRFRVGKFMLDKDMQIHLYRVIQEIIHNSIKHSFADSITLEISRVKNRYRIKISDNGKGFDYVTISEETKGLGLKNIISRVEALRGSLQIDSRDGAGTTYQIGIPITVKNEQ